MLSSIITLLKFLPEFLELAKKIGNAVDRGFDYIQIKNAMNDIDKAFKQKGPQERARSLNDVFRK